MLWMPPVSMFRASKGWASTGSCTHLPRGWQGREGKRGVRLTAGRAAHTIRILACSEAETAPEAR